MYDRGGVVIDLNANLMVIPDGSTNE